MPTRLTQDARAVQPPRVELFHPFTARSIGWPDERELPRFHSAPHALALQQLTEAGRLRGSISYLRDSPIPRRQVVNGLSYRWLPRDPWQLASRAGYRQERSWFALASVAARRPDVLIINFSGHGSALAQQLARHRSKTGLPYVYMIGGATASYHGPQRPVLDGAAAIVVHQRALRGELIDLGIPPHRVLVMPLGVDVEQFHPGPARQRRGRVLYVGRVARCKNLGLLIASLAALEDASWDLRVVGPTPDASYLHELRSMALERGVGDRVSFSGPLDRADLIAEYQAADVLVLPSKDEGFGMVMVEAMACGVPVVALRGSGGPDDVVVPGETGFLVEPDQLPSAVGTILGDGALRERMGRSARDRAVQHFSSQATATSFEAVIAASQVR